MPNKLILGPIYSKTMLLMIMLSKYQCSNEKEDFWKLPAKYKRGGRAGGREGGREGGRAGGRYMYPHFGLKSWIHPYR